MFLAKLYDLVGSAMAKAPAAMAKAPAVTRAIPARLGVLAKLSDLVSSRGSESAKATVPSPRNGINARPCVVLSLTTTPQRLVTLAPTLQSILSQTVTADKVYLNIPRFSRRHNREYKVPASVSALPIEINWCEEYGPATKLIPTLQKEKEPTTVILSIDDDMLYPHGHIETLLNALQQWPHAAYCFAGQQIDEEETIAWCALYSPIIVVPGSCKMNHTPSLPRLIQ
eukprot:85778-Prymnesium_polylepis.1